MSASAPEAHPSEPECRYILRYKAYMVLTLSLRSIERRLARGATSEELAVPLARCLKMLKGGEYLSSFMRRHGVERAIPPSPPEVAAEDN